MNERDFVNNYSTPLDMSRISDEQRREAERIANEIEGNAQPRRDFEDKGKGKHHGKAGGRSKGDGKGDGKGKQKNRSQQIRQPQGNPGQYITPPPGVPQSNHW